MFMGHSIPLKPSISANVKVYESLSLLSVLLSSGGGCSVKGLRKDAILNTLD